ncbi:MAG: hypothetical protein WD750_08470 [Gammaproteobacteria bacterium]
MTVKLFSSRRRPMHLGPYPLERLARAQTPAHGHISGAAESLQLSDPENPLSLANSMQPYMDVVDNMRTGTSAKDEAPIPTDAEERARHMKAACYFLDAGMAAVCRIDGSMHLATPVENASLQQSRADTDQGKRAGPEQSVFTTQHTDMQVDKTTELAGHSHALIILVEYSRDPEPGEPGYEWLRNTQAQRAAVLAAEIAGVMTCYLRFLGFDARTHTATARELDFDRLLLASGLAESGGNGAGGISNPYLGTGFGTAAVSTTLTLAADKPLTSRGLRDQWRAHGPGWWFGFNGSRPGYAGRPYKNRSFHLGPFPMEKLKRVESTTTLIDADNIPRVPKRHNMFLRAAKGDLGEKTQYQVRRFVPKSPFSHATAPLMSARVPLQSGTPAGQTAPGTDDPGKNADAIKAALYYLGADMVGICELKNYAWYSHDSDGSPITPYHKYGIAILIDQGYETMEGASGDDWISGAQSMRGYLRAQLTGGIVSSHIRSLGYPARCHSSMDQDVLHIPIILEAGLGELSRIGELVLNPFVGPRFKSGVITTDMPLEPDKPVDFGLQDFCNQCNKCARECPCSAIPFGDKIMFNGYEMWKPDVEKCARYRITNPGGSACGRCMKTCPWNIEGVLKERPFLWAAMHLPFTRKWIAKLDDKIGNGRINPVKKWWWDLDTDDNGKVIPAKRSNARQLVFRQPIKPEEQKLACYPPDLAPAPDSDISGPDRNRGVEAYRKAIKPEIYRQGKATRH